MNFNLTARQAIDLLDNGIIPVIIINSLPTLWFNYITGYTLFFNNSPKSSNNTSYYTFYTLFGDTLYATDLDSEISITLSGGGNFF